VFAFVSTGAFVVGILVAAARQQWRVFRVPWWWWVGNGASMVLLSLGNAFEILSLILLAAGALSIGVGVTLLVVDYRSGNITFKRKPQLMPTGEVAWRADWQSGAKLLRVRDVDVLSWDSANEKLSPYIEFDVAVTNGSLHEMAIEKKLEGRIKMPNERQTMAELGHPPEIVGVRTGRYPGDAIPLKRNEDQILVVRQHVDPMWKEVFRSYAGKTLETDFSNVQMWVRLERREAGEVEKKRDSCAIGKRYDVTVPDWFEFI
jgi:hypothetical protein